MNQAVIICATFISCVTVLLAVQMILKQKWDLSVKPRVANYTVNVTGILADHEQIAIQTVLLDDEPAIRQQAKLDGAFAILENRLNVHNMRILKIQEDAKFAAQQADKNKSSAAAAEGRLSVINQKGHS